MNPLVMTIIAAVVIMGLVVLGLAVGRLITGKNKLRKGCGMTPKDKGQCNICGKPSCEDEEKKDDSDTSSRKDKK